MSLRPLEPTSRVAEEIPRIPVVNASIRRFCNCIQADATNLAHSKANHRRENRTPNTHHRLFPKSRRNVFDEDHHDAEGHNHKTGYREISLPESADVVRAPSVNVRVIRGSQSAESRATQEANS
jgi:hypothetical protein